MFCIFLFPFKLAFFLLFLFLLMVSVFFVHHAFLPFVNSSFCRRIPAWSTLTNSPLLLFSLHVSTYSQLLSLLPFVYFVPRDSPLILHLLVSGLCSIYVGFRKFFLSLIFTSHQNDFVSSFLSPASTIRVFSYLSSFPAFI